MTQLDASPTAAAIAAATTAPTASLPRRAVLGAAASGAALAPLVAGASTPAAAAATLPSVRPVWSEKLRRNFGVVVHPNLAKTGYQNIEACLNQVAAMNVTYIRGR